jgi:hypothetical protein
MAQLPIQSAGKFALELQGKTVGLLQSAAGGEAFGTVVGEPPNADGIIKKHIKPVEYAAITITFSGGMGAELYAWIAEMIARKQTPRDGAIRYLSFDSTEVQRLEWTGGVITAVVFPAADGASKDHAFLAVTIDPVRTTLKPGSGKVSSGLPQATKQWLAANFAFTLTGFDPSATSRVRSVDAFSVTQSFSDDGRTGLQAPSAPAGPAPAGPARVGVLQVGLASIGVAQASPVQLSNLVLTVALTFAQPWLDWVEDFLIKGNAGDDAERTGTLQFLDPTLKNAWFTLTLYHVGPVRARRQIAAGADAIAQLEMEMYCESAMFTASDN